MNLTEARSYLDELPSQTGRERLELFLRTSASDPDTGEAVLRASAGPIDSDPNIYAMTLVLPTRFVDESDFEVEGDTLDQHVAGCCKLLAEFVQTAPAQVAPLPGF